MLNLSSLVGINNAIFPSVEKHFFRFQSMLSRVVYKVFKDKFKMLLAWCSGFIDTFSKHQMLWVENFLMMYKHKNIQTGSRKVRER